MRTLIGLIVGLVAADVGWAAAKSFPAHWGQPPQIQTMDIVPLPGGYGEGSSTLAKWISTNLEKDQQRDGGQVLFAASFDKAALGRLPDEYLVLDGMFEVKEAEGNRFVELPGAPLETYGVLFGPAEASEVAVTARIQSSLKGRRYPVFGVGLNGVGGYKLQVAPAKDALELFKGEERVASVEYTWKNDSWTRLRLQIRKAGEGEWKVEGRAWTDGTNEPRNWAITFVEKTEPMAGRPSVWGSPFSGQPIRFDDLVVVRPESKS